MNITETPKTPITLEFCMNRLYNAVLQLLTLILVQNCSPLTIQHDSGTTNAIFPSSVCVVTTTVE